MEHGNTIPVQGAHDTKSTFSKCKTSIFSFFIIIENIFCTDLIVFQVNFPCRLLREPGDISITVCIVIIHRHVLDEYGNTCILKSGDFSCTNSSSKVAIFWEVLKVTSAEWSSVGVHSWSIGSCKTVFHRLMCICNTKLISKLRTPCGSIYNCGSKPGVYTIRIVSVSGFSRSVYNTCSLFIYRSNLRSLPSHASRTGDVFLNGKLVNQISPDFIVIANFFQDRAVYIQTHGSLICCDLVVSIGCFFRISFRIN